MLPIDDGDPCTAVIVSWPNNNADACPEPTRVVKKCDHMTECGPCEQKVNITNDQCCGEQYECGNALIFAIF